VLGSLLEKRVMMMMMLVVGCLCSVCCVDLVKFLSVGASCVGRSVVAPLPVVLNEEVLQGCVCQRCNSTTEQAVSMRESRGAGTCMLAAEATASLHEMP